MIRIFLNKIVLLALVSSLVGCIYTSVKAPGPVNNQTQYLLTTEDYKVLGTVEAEGIYKAYGPFVGLGGKGYEELYAKAKALGGDEIINHVFEVEGYSIFLIVYNEAKWHARATAIQYTEKAKKSTKSGNP
jgi:hypothetical protein